MLIYINQNPPHDISKYIVCIDGYGTNSEMGRLYNKYEPKCINFSSIMHLVFILEDIISKFGFPQSYEEYRSFSKEKSKKRTTRKREFVEYMKGVEFEGINGIRETFMVNIKFRQNATWQGSITWLEENKSRNFRSALELIKLIDDAVKSSEDKDICIGWEK